MKTNKFVFLIALSTTFCSYTSQAAPLNFKIDASHTRPYYEVDHLGFSFERGSFDKVAGNISIDKAAKTGSAEITIEVASLTSGWKERDETLKGKDFFNVERFPNILFKSTQFNFFRNDLTSIDGNLTLLGVTKSVRISISRFHCGNHPILKVYWCGAEASANIKRSEFGMNTYIPAISDEVHLVIPVEAGNL